MPDSCVVIGCGGHSAAVISIIESIGLYHIVGLVDVAKTYNAEEQKSGYNVIFNLDELVNNACNYRHLNCFIAVGDNYKRQDVYSVLHDLGYKFPNIVANSAFVDRTVVMDEGNIIGHGVIINAQARLGSNNLINSRAVIEHHSTLKNHIHIAPGAVICGDVDISCFSFIGAGAVILPHISVADKFTLGAGSVLVTNVKQSKETFVGIPGKGLIK